MTPNLAALKHAGHTVGRTTVLLAREATRAVLQLGHNVLAIIGLTVVAAIVFAAGRADLHHQFEVMALDWLQNRHVARVEASGDLLALIDEPEAVARATAVHLSELPKPQAAVVQWLSRRYKVAPEPLGRLVQEAWTIGERAKLDPTLILAIMAIESNFNPFAQSPMGAQGLMQVMTRVHDDKYEAFGGTLAAFDPVTNLRVGVQVLKECIQRAGSVEAGLRYYVGAALLEHDNGYAARVLAEQQHLQRVSQGQRVPVNASSRPPVLREAEATPAPAAEPQQPEVERVAMLGR